MLDYFSYRIAKRTPVYSIAGMPTKLLPFTVSGVTSALRSRLVIPATLPSLAKRSDVRFAKRTGIAAAFCNQHPESGIV